MVDVINIQAEDNRNIIDDDAVPTLTLENTNAGGTVLKAVASTSGGNALDVNVTGTGIGLDLDVTGNGVGIDVDVAGTGDAANLYSSAGQAIDALGIAASQIKSGATAASALIVQHNSTILSSPTVAPLKVLTSVASAPLIDFGVVDSGGVISAATSGPTLAARVRVKIGNVYGWLDVKES